MIVAQWGQTEEGSTGSAKNSFVKSRKIMREMNHSNETAHENDVGEKIIKKPIEFFSNGCSGVDT